jgi:glutamate--cysteine ligase
VTGDTNLDGAAVARFIEAATFGRPDPAQPMKIGIEAELIPVDAVSRKPVSISPGLLPVIERHAADEGWTAVHSPKGAPQFDVAGGGRLTFEPGGQVEYATPPFVSPGALLENVRRVVGPLTRAAADAGIDLVGAGIDPFNGPAAAPLQIEADRYRQMDAYFATIGDAGARMMRQSASIQVNVDAGPEPHRSWKVLNAAAPYLTAIFANSRCYAGADSGHANYRARTWQMLDPSRTGLAWSPTGDAAGYVAFALEAKAIFERAASGEYLPFRDRVRDGAVTPDVAALHLSTLFPEVRPRGWFEVRSIDAQRPEWYAAPVLIIAGLAFDAEALLQADELLGTPDPELLERAAREGLRDTALGRGASDLVRIAMEGCRRLGSLCGDRDIGEALEFFQEFTLPGRSPADSGPQPGSIATAA